MSRAKKQKVEVKVKKSAIKKAVKIEKEALPPEEPIANHMSNIPPEGLAEKLPEVIFFPEVLHYVGKRICPNRLRPDIDTFKRKLSSWWTNKRLVRRPHHPSMHKDPVECECCSINQPTADEEYARI